MPRLLQLLYILSTLFLAWYLMQLLHESGHCLAALLTGAHIDHLSLPLLSFSQTFLSEDTHPLLTTWSGPLLGSLFPLALFLPIQLLRLPLYSVARFIAAFSLLANGLYLASAPVLLVADTLTLHHLSTPTWLLLLTGLPLFTLGLLLLNHLSPHFTVPKLPPPSQILSLPILLVTLLILESIFT